MGLHNESISVLVVKDGPPTTIFAGSISDFSAGTQGGFFRTTNQGVTWDTLLRGFSIASIVIPSSSLDTIFVGTSIPNYSIPGILRSTDAGKRWSWSHDGIHVDPETGVRSIAFEPSSPHIMYATTGGFYGGLMYKSTNGGATWQELSTPGDGSYGPILLLPGGAGRLIVGTTGTGKVLRSTDGGDTWSVPLNHLNTVRCLDSDSTGEIVFVGFHSPGGKPLGKSSDSGISWLQTSIVDTLRTAAFSITVNGKTSSTLFAVANGNTVGRGIFKSTDGAMSWQSLPSPDSLPNVVYYDASTGVLFVGCQRLDRMMGGVYRLDGPMDVDPRRQAEQPLQLFAYPNPFNSQVTISLDLQRRSHVTMEVFDIRGRMVWRATTGELHVGRHEWIWSAVAEPSGIYFFRATAQTCAITQKILLVR